MNKFILKIVGQYKVDTGFSASIFKQADEKPVDIRQHLSTSGKLVAAGGHCHKNTAGYQQTNGLDSGQA
jgi:hypothetical protein